VERGTTAAGFALPLAQKAGDEAPYFSLVLVPGWRSRR
jgi:precorrin-2/cobalt-factor-2 C20-methyltransferase